MYPTVSLETVADTHVIAQSESGEKNEARAQLQSNERNLAQNRHLGCSRFELHAKRGFIAGDNMCFNIDATNEAC